MELKDLQIARRIGTYGPKDDMLDAHLLDRTLTIARHMALIAQDELALVFGYDPLIRQIEAVARASRCKTQDRLMARIVKACAAYPQIEALDICLRKRSVLSGSSTL